MSSEEADRSQGSSAQWDRADRLLFSWLDHSPTDIDARLNDLAQRDADLAAAVRSRVVRLRRIGMQVADHGAVGPQPGSMFGEFRIVEALGTGGMGTVYLAEQTTLARRVALKVIRGDRLRDRQSRERFQRETRAVAALRDPGICAVLDAGEVDGTPYLAMQYIDGETLAEQLAGRRAKGRRGPDDSGPSTAAEIGGVLELIEKVARSLHVAHEAGVIHRDIKPGNVMIDSTGTPVLVDFGLARIESETDATLTLTGDVLGTPAYMSPEQVRPGRGAVDRRSDVYSLAVTLYECLTHERPFAGSTAVMLFEAIERDPTPDPRRHNPHLPADVSAVLARAMEKEPARRYATAPEFADELARLRRHEPVRARRIGLAGRSWRWTQRNPRAAAMLTGLTVALLTVVVLLRQAIDQREEIRTTAQVAKTAAASAETARVRESERRAELEQVARFQDLQLRGIDVQAMGMRVRSDLFAGMRTAWLDAKYSEPEIAARAREAEEKLAGTNFTDLALATLRQTVLERSVQAIRASFADQPLVRARLLQATADTARELGLLEFALEPQQEALRVRRELLGPDDPSTLVSLNNQGVLLRIAGKAEEARKVLAEALTRTRALRTDRHRETIEALMNLALAEQKLDRSEDVRTHLGQARDLAAEILAADDPLQLELDGFQADVLKATGAIDAALQLYRAVFAACVRVHGDDSDVTNQARNSLGIALLKTGKFDEAEPVLRGCLESRVRHAGEDHYDTLQSRHNLGLLLQGLGHQAEAEDTFRHSLEQCDRIFGPFDWRTAFALNGLAGALAHQGKRREAIAHLQRAVDISRRREGPEHSNTLLAESNLGAVLGLEGRIDESLALLDHVLTVSRIRFGPDDPRCLDAMLKLGQALVAKGDLDAAEPLCKECLERHRAVFGPDDPRTLAAMNRQSGLLYARHDLPAAMALVQEWLDGCRRIYPEGHRETRVALHSLGSMLDEHGDAARAEACFRELVRLVKGDPEASSWELDDAGGWLGILLLDKARTSQVADERLHIVREAEPLLVAEAERLLADDAATGKAVDAACNRVATLHEVWHTVEPAGGHEAQATAWRERAQKRRGR